MEAKAQPIFVQRDFVPHFKVRDSFGGGGSLRVLVSYDMSPPQSA